MATATTTNYQMGQSGQTGLGGQAGRTGQANADDEAQKHSEGPVALSIEHYTAQMPSDWFLWAAGASILASLTLQALGRKENALFVGQWVAPFMLLGVYNKIVKVAGSDRVHES